MSGVMMENISTYSVEPWLCLAALGDDWCTERWPLDMALARGKRGEKVV